MIKLIIADDERIIRETISNLIDWKSLGITLVGLAKDGNEAYNMILDECPDIVLTDIRMPGLSGLDLIRKTNEVNTNTQFIILSGYSEFEYAKQAMEYGVRHYILKPCNEEQIISCIRKVLRTISEQVPFRELEAERQRFAATMHHQLFMNVIHDSLVLEAPKETAGYRSIYRKYRKFIDFENDRYEMFELPGLEAERMTQAVAALERQRRQRAPGIFYSYLYVHRRLILIFQSYKEDYPVLEALLQTLCAPAAVRRQTYANLEQLFSELLERISKYEIFRYSDGNTATTIYNYKNLIRDIGQYAEESYSSDPAAAGAAYAALTEQLSAISDISLLKQLASSLMLLAASKSLRFTPLAATEFLMGIAPLESCSALIARLLPQLESIYAEYHSAHRSGELSDMVKTYVREHISDPRLSLKWISEHVLYMNEDYVGRKFFKETGEKFSNYVTNVRIQTAKELLAGTESDKIQDIAELVGCGNNPQYFSQIFKKQTGQTPSSYVRMIRGGS